MGLEKNSDNPVIWYNMGNIHLQMQEFHKAIDDGQDLSVVLQYKNGFDILEWKIVSTADWTPDESLHVWDGGMLFDE